VIARRPVRRRWGRRPSVRTVPAPESDERHAGSHRPTLSPTSGTGSHAVRREQFDELYASLADRSSRKLLNRLARVPLLCVDLCGAVARRKRGNYQPSRSRQLHISRDIPPSTRSLPIARQCPPGAEGKARARAALLGDVASVGFVVAPRREYRGVDRAVGHRSVMWSRARGLPLNMRDARPALHITDCST
jgi:hypothetical protein